MLQTNKYFVGDRVWIEWAYTTIHPKKFAHVIAISKDKTDKGETLYWLCLDELGLRFTVIADQIRLVSRGLIPAELYTKFTKYKEG